MFVLGVLGTVYYVYLLLQGGRSALIWASEKGRKECVEALLQRGADVNLRSPVSSTSQGSEMSAASMCPCSLCGVRD